MFEYFTTFNRFSCAGQNIPVVKSPANTDGSIENSNITPVISEPSYKNAREKFRCIHLDNGIKSFRMCLMFK